jgi:hypothetical protein
MTTITSLLPARQRRQAAALPAEPAVWQPREWAIWAVLQIGAIAACVMAYALAADKIVYRDQLPLVNISLGGIFLSILAHGFVLALARRRIGQRRLDLLGAAPRRRRPASGSVRETAMAVVAGDGSAFYHRPACDLAVGKDWPLTGVEQMLQQSRTPCPVCAP